MSDSRAHRNLKNEVRLALGRREDVVMWNNESGVARYGTSVVRYGVGKGGSDLIGIIKGSGRFLAIEIKTGNARLTKEQKLFQQLVRAFGGVAETVRTVDDATGLIDHIKRQAAKLH